MDWADSPAPDPGDLGELAHTSAFRRRARIGGWLGVIAVVAIVAIAVAATRSSPAATPSAGIVRVMLKTHAGTGFFVAGPDELAYVVTAYHVIDSGEPILIEQTIEVAGGKPYVEAYPDVSVVAFDADADLAVLRLDNVRADHFATLQLADAPVKDEAVLSYGFPASSLSKTASMMSKPGKI
ncbi:MAG TPA: serine protease, partial [Kofleriaceae bacterium]